MIKRNQEVQRGLEQIEFLLEDAKRCCDDEKWVKVGFRIDMALKIIKEGLNEASMMP